MLEVVETHEFARWFDGLPESQAKESIRTRIDRLAFEEYSGDSKPVREGVSEIRINHGPGYRIYFHQHGHILVVLLAGGTKGSQDQDIKKALQLLRDIKKTK